MEWYIKIKIHNNDSLFDIFKKIQKATNSSSSFYLEVDDNNALRNFLNLKLLISKFAGKKFAIITSNKDLKRIWEKLWIKYFYKSDEIEFDEKFSKTNVLRHNFTFSEYLKYELKRLFLKNFFILKKKAKTTYKNKSNTPQSHVFLLIIWLILSFSLLSFIFYFAVSKTYIYITPELSVKTVSRNIVFSEKDNNNLFDSKNVVRINPMSMWASLSSSFHVSTIDEASAKNAYWVVEIFNELNTWSVLKPNTTFQSEDWLIFKSSDWIKIPPASRWSSWEIIMWKTEVTLVADMYDNMWKIIGTRWNIKSWTMLTIPKLKFNRDKIYAKTKEDFKEWLDPKIHVLTQKEFDNFSQIMADKIKAKTLDNLKEKIKNMNAMWWTNFIILPIDNILKYEIGKVELGSWTKIWDKLEEVTLNCTGSLSTYVFDKSATIFYLKSILNENILLWTEKLIWINEDSLRITNILNQSVNPFYMKATTELDSKISYNFEDSSNNLTKKLKNLIANTSKDDATSVLLNDSNISTVKIEFSPFWLTRVSNNPDNIEFIIDK